MIPNLKHRQLSSSGVAASGTFGISAKDSCHIMQILRDTLYSDKVLAVLREYSSNAWDAHREADRADMPIKVTLPTEMAPTLSIRDRGPGLSPEEVFEVYTQYGASTKRESDVTVGTMGIGCLLKGQPIVTVMGMKPIEEVQVGDLVLTHRNRYRRVTEIMRRPHKGPAYRVWTSQNPEPLILTANHPILVGNHLGELRWSKPGDITTGYRSKKKGIEAWNSYAVLPAAIESTVQHLHTLAFLGSGYSFEEGVCRKSTDHGTRWATRATRTTRWPEFPERLNLDEELGWLLGLYAAEGSASQKQVTVSLNISEKDLAARFTYGMRKYFGVDFKWYERPSKTLLELVAHHTPLARLLGQLCGSGAKYKAVPWPVMMGSTEVRKGFLRGVLDGDGSSTRARFVFGVSSPSLAWGVRTLMATVEDKWGTVGTMENYPNRWSINYNREASWGYSHRKGNHLLRPIIKTEVFELEAEVFNFSVEDDESYVSDFVLHNSKAGFAYSDTFTVISWHGGTKSTYIAVLDATDTGVINLLHEEPCGLETGVEIQITVREDDIEEFETTAQKLFKYFVPRPEINTEIPPSGTDEKVFQNGSIYGFRGSGWVAVMGCIPYRINLDQIRTYQGGIQNCVNRLSGCLRFNIGEVHISASREELKYSDLTKQALKEKFALLVDEYVQQVVQRLDSVQCTPWEKRWQYSEFSQLDLPLPKGYEQPDDSFAINTEATLGPKTFMFTPNTKNKPMHRLHLPQEARILLRDDSHRWLGSYDIKCSDVLVRKFKNSTWAAVEAELTKFLADHLLTGIPVLKLSAMGWTPPKAGNTTSWTEADPKKYKFRTFRLIPDALLNRKQGRKAPSRAWEAFPHQPEAGDVYVVLQGFLPGWGGLAENYRADQEVAECCGEIMPAVYGYRSTKHHEVTLENLAGMEYLTWRTAFRQRLRELPKVHEYITLVHWARMFERFKHWPWRRDEKKLLGLAARTLGSKHYVVQFLVTGRRMAAFKSRHPNRQIMKAAELLLQPSLPNSAEQALQTIFTKYPLLSLDPQFFDTLLGDHQQLWLDYVKTVDAGLQERP